VSLRVDQHDGAGFLEVHDTGIGIPANAQPYVFDRFYRVDEARSREDGREDGGTGLGLSIVRSICSAHGAEISVESTPGRGSRFRIKFPQLAPRAAFGTAGGR
jgi:signal transduction histidine kinase